MHTNLTLLPVLLFLGVLLGIGYYCNKKLARSGDFQKDYFIANRSLGGIVLAMTLVATYGSVSSFVSGPGVAWNLGLGWVVFAAPQIITGFFLLGIVGKKLAVIARKTEAITIIDVLQARYRSAPLSIMLSVVLLVFFTAMVVGQFIGGAQIFAAITGLDYQLGLLLFALVTVIYTSSGFKAVVLTDAVCAVLMLVGMFALGAVILHEGQGLPHIMQTIARTNPGADGISNHLKPDASGALPYSLLFSAWLLVGFCTLGLPQSMVRCLSYRRTEDLHRAMLVATIVCGALMIGMTLLGVLARGVVDEMPQNGTDAVIPLLIVSHMSPLLAGITIIGPLAATMSTVSSLLISASSAIVRDLALQLKRPTAPALGSRQRISVLITLALGAIAILLSLYPQDIVVWVNMFAFGGLESAFLWPLVLGLFWSRMNACGALLGVVMGLGCYLIFMIGGFKILGFHNIVVGTLAGLIFSLVGSWLGQENPRQVLAVFFPQQKYPAVKTDPAGSGR